MRPAPRFVLATGASILTLSWAVLASLAARAWENRARAAEGALDDKRARKSASVAQGNRTRAQLRRITIEERTAQLRLAIEARPIAPGEEVNA